MGFSVIGGICSIGRSLVDTKFDPNWFPSLNSLTPTFFGLPILISRPINSLKALLFLPFGSSLCLFIIARLSPPKLVLILPKSLTVKGCVDSTRLPNNAPLLPILVIKLSLSVVSLYSCVDANSMACFNNDFCSSFVSFCNLIFKSRIVFDVPSICL